MKKSTRPKAHGTMHLYRVFVIGEDSEVYDERFIFARNGNEGYRFGAGKGLSVYAYEMAKLGWTIEEFEQSHWARINSDGHLERIMEYIRTHTIKENMPFWVPDIGMEAEKVPTDTVLKGEYVDA